MAMDTMSAATEIAYTPALSDRDFLGFLSSTLDMILIAD